MKRYILTILALNFIVINSIIPYKCSCSGHIVECNDGSWSNSSGSGTCSGHGGVK